MSDEFDLEPERPGPEPRFRLEANTWEELLDQLREIAPESSEFRFLTPKKERPLSLDRSDPPERLGHGDLGRLADELSMRLEHSPSFPDDEGDAPTWDRSDWHPAPRSGRGAVLQRLYARRARRLESEAGYVWLHDAMLARELTDRNEAVRELERVGDAARLERLAEHSPHRITRRAALDALERLKAVPGLESAALYVRPEVFIPKKPKPTGDEPESVSKKTPEFYDDTRDHAIDLLAKLADEENRDAFEALMRIVRYDFSRDTLARLRALRRLGERVDRLERHADWEGLALLYRESRSVSLHREVVGRLATHLGELEEASAVDALLAVADLRTDLQEAAEAAVHRLEKQENRMERQEIQLERQEDENA